jgi:peptide deformylase
LFANFLEHDIDHLNGRLFIDHLSKLKRSIALRKSAKLKRQGD